MKFTYPQVQRDPSVVDDYHGTKVNDPYRWLEDLDSAETKKFVDEQNKLMRDYLAKCPIKDKIEEKIKDMYNYPKISSPKKAGNRYFFLQNSGLQAQSVLYMQESLDSEPEVLMDPNTWSADGTKAICSVGNQGGLEFSKDGKYVAYFVTEGGSDWTTIQFMDIDTGKQLDDTLVNCKFATVAWMHDNMGVFYTRFDNVSRAEANATESNTNQKVYFHRLGDKQEQDVLVAEWPENPNWMVFLGMSDCGRYLLYSMFFGSVTNNIFISDLEAQVGQIKGKLPMKELLSYSSGTTMYVTNDGTRFTFRTNAEASNYKLIQVDINQDRRENVKTLVPEVKDSVLEWAIVGARNRLVVCYLKDVNNVVDILDIKTGNKLKQLDLDLGTVPLATGSKDDDMIFINFTSYLRPAAIYTCNLADGKYEVKMFKEAKIPGFDANAYEAKQVFYASKDGTRIPMTVVHKKGLQLDSTHPALMHGYGGFGISLVPNFVHLVLGSGAFVFLKHFGGVLAYPNLRGGGEYGEDWHKAGILDKKQNVFDDFQAAAKYLSDNGYTTPHKLTITGISNGGFLVGACINQQPGLFGCAILQSGVTDLIRLSKSTIGHLMYQEFGNVDVPEQFEFIIRTSPLHNIEVPQGRFQYPALMVHCGDHDDRCPPGMHSYKFMAEIQHTVGRSPKQTNPLMLNVEKDAGHFQGKPISKKIEEMTDIYTFMALTMELKWSTYL